MCSSLLKKVALFACVVFGHVASVATLYGEELFVTHNQHWPGLYWKIEGPDREFEAMRRDVAAATTLNTIPRVANVAVLPDGRQFFVSGLDNAIMNNLDGHEVTVFTVDGQIRDIDCGRETNAIYFSVVPTPQAGEALQDGKIYRRDLYAATNELVATVPQNQVGGNWWGAFAVKDGAIIVGVNHANGSKFYKVNGGHVEAVMATSEFQVAGFNFDNNGDLVFTTGTPKIYRTTDFSRVDPVHVARQNLNDVFVKKNAR